jgi:outer membrane protein assembly factor BamB
VYGQVETGYDYPERGRGAVRPGKLARRWIIALIVGILAGAAIMLQVKGWWTLGSEAGGACGSGRGGVSYGACPRGITPALVLSFIVGFGAVPAALVLVFRPGWARRGFLAVGAAAGVLAGQALFGLWHGTDLAVAWAAPFDTTSELTTVGAWVTGDSLVRVRVDEVVSYSAATGAQQWTLTVPGTDVACALSGLGPGTGAESGTGLVLYGPDSTTCDHIMAVDLATGRQLWAAALPSQDHGGISEATGQLAVAGGTAIALTDDGPVGFSVSSGDRLWGPVRPADCSVRQLAGSGSSLVALGSCYTGSGTPDSDDVFSLSPATGKPVWDHRITEPSDSYSLQILSVSPLVISEEGSGPRGTASVRVLGPDGTQSADFRVDGIMLAGSPVALNVQPSLGFGPPDFVAGGMLVGVTATSGGQSAIVAYRLSDGHRQWVTATPDEVHDITVSGGRAILVDESEPAYSLESLDLASGKLHSLGFFSQAIMETDESGLYAVGGSYLIVNQHGSRTYEPPVTAIRVPATKS